MKTERKKPDAYTYVCPNSGVRCRLHKRCFVLKTPIPIKSPFIVYYKCPAEKRDIEIDIGEP